MGDRETSFAARGVRLQGLQQILELIDKMNYSNEKNRYALVFKMLHLKIGKYLMSNDETMDQLDTATIKSLYCIYLHTFIQLVELLHANGKHAEKILFVDENHKLLFDILRQNRLISSHVFFNRIYFKISGFHKRFADMAAQSGNVKVAIMFEKRLQDYSKWLQQLM